MKNIAPDIFRQRVLIEGFFTIEVNPEVIKNYFFGLAKHLELKTYSEPTIFSPRTGMGKEENAGYDAFIPLIDSGISLYVWSKAKFISIIIYTCKGFDENSAVQYTKEFFKLGSKIENLSF